MKIYALHKGDYDYQYVGSTTTDLNVRLRNHFKAARFHRRSSVQQWLNVEPWLVRIELLEEVDAELAKYSEAKWIAALGTYSNGVNSNAAGVGTSQGVKHSERSRAAASKAAASMNEDPLVRRKQTASGYSREFACSCGRSFESKFKYMGHKRWCG